MPGTDPGSSALPSQSVLTIDLGAITANYRALRTRLGGTAACAAVVKADAYGLGAARVAPVLAVAGCKTFFVAHLGEAIALRPLLPQDCSVYVLHGIQTGEIPSVIEHGVIPVLNDLGQVRAWNEAARAAGKRLRGILQFDTGMSRLGLNATEAAELAADRSIIDGIELDYVMSHLACSELPDHSLNAQQLSEFQQLRAQWPDVKASLVNSSGIYLPPAYFFDLARPGAALYGINPTPMRRNPLRGAVTLSGKILQIREVDPPRTVGYGATFRVSQKTRVATVALGYADGWLRALVGKGGAFYRDTRIPIIGRISMDLITLDLSRATQATTGELVEFIGPHQSVDDVAAAAGTNGYEVFCRLGQRFHRIYREDDAAS
jgi:alanine racemase